MESFARVIAAVVVAVAATSTPLDGTWALSYGKPAIAARMFVQPGPDGNLRLAIAQTTPSGTPIRKYNVDMTMLMHVIVITDDFLNFQHLHPTFDASTGRFTFALAPRPSQRYYVYADSDPAGYGHQVFRFTLQPDAPHGTPPMQGTPSDPKTKTGPYEVTLSTTALKAHVAQPLEVTITRDGKPASDLQPYLGAAAHAVFIDTSSLAYVHIHPMVKGTQMAGMDMATMGDMDMGGGKAGPKMMLSLPSLAPGTYVLWLQFQGKSGLYVAAFRLVVS